MTATDWGTLRDEALNGLKAVAKNRSYTIDGVTYTRESADALGRLLDKCEARIRELNDGGIRIESVVIV